MIRRPPLTSQQKLRHEENGDLSWLISHIVSVSGRCRHGLDPNKTAFHFPSTLFHSSIPKAFTHLLKITSVLMKNQSQHLTQYYFSPNTATILLGNNFFTSKKRNQDLGCVWGRRCSWKQLLCHLLQEDGKLAFLIALWQHLESSHFRGDLTLPHSLWRYRSPRTKGSGDISALSPMSPSFSGSSAAYRLSGKYSFPVPASHLPASWELRKASIYSGQSDFSSGSQESYL